MYVKLVGGEKNGIIIPNVKFDFVEIPRDKEPMINDVYIRDWRATPGPDEPVPFKHIGWKTYEQKEKQGLHTDKQPDS